MLIDSVGFLWFTCESQLMRFDGRNFKGYAGRQAQQKSSRVAYIHYNQNGKPYFQIVDDPNCYALPGSKDSLQIIPNQEHSMLLPPVNGADAVYVSGAAFDNVLKLVGESPKRVPNGWAPYTLLRRINNHHFYFAIGFKYYFVDTDKNLTTELPKVNVSLNYKLFTLGDIAVVYNEKDVQYFRNGKQLNPSSIEGLQNISRVILSKKFKRIDSYVSKDHQFFILDSKIYKVLLSNTSISMELLLVLDNDEFITCVTIDNFSEQEILFVGTSSSGLYVASKKHLDVLRFNSSFPMSNAFYTMQALPDGSIITANGVFDREGKSKVNPSITIEAKRYFRSKIGALWSVEGSYDKKKTVITDLLLTKNNRTFPGAFGAICDGDNGDVYFSINNRFTANKDVIRKLGIDGTITDYDLTKYLGNPVPYSALAYEGKGVILVASRDNLFRYSTKTNKLLKNWGSLGGDVRSIYVKDSTVFISTYGKGIFRLRNNELTPMPIDIGKSLLYTHAFIKDKKGFLWMPTNNGLIQAKEKDMISYSPGQKEAIYFYRYTKADGLLSTEFNGGNAMNYDIDYQGNLLLPSMDGLVKVYLNHIKPIAGNPKFAIENIFLDDSLLSITGKRFEVSSGVQNLRFEIAAPYFGNPANYILEYNLEGLNKEWSTIEPDATINFQRLPAGDYTLKIRAKFNFNDSYKYQSVSFTVLPVWYRSWWFLITVIVLIVAAFILTDQYRKWQKEKMRQSLQAEIKQQSDLLDKRFEEIKEKSEALARSRSISDKLESLLFHDLRSPLFFIEKTSKMLTRMFTGKEDDDLKLSLDAIAVSAENIRGLSESIVEWIALQNKQFTTTSNTISVKNMVETAVLFYGGAIELNANDVEILIDDALTITSDQKLLSAITRNLVDNANKNMQHGKISINARKENNKLHLVIKDNGPGISDDAIQYINAMMFNQSTDHIKGRYGFGLRIVIDFLKVLDGHLTIQTDNGTSIEIVIPESVKKENG